MSENKAETVAAAAESNDNPKAGVDFIRARIMDDNASGRFGGQVHTRFPPEPNGYLHLGHAKSICLNFGVAREFGGMCNLRFDDTNPVKEDTEYVDSIREDVKWLGGEWDDREFYASNYFDKLYEYAEQLILKGKAYVDDLSADEIREYRGTLTRPGKESPCRNRSVEENLDLFRRMRAGEFADGEHVLRAKIDMASPNLVMRDPTLYRIRHAEHHRTGNKWCIYPMYDFTHCLSDSLEGITHSICTLEFENNRELYDWVLDALEVYHPQQIEFARLNLTHTVLSKRKLIQLVKEGYVKGWDDPRMPTLSGLRRRGVPPEALREFCSRIGIARSDSMVDYAVLEFCIREYLNAHTPRAMAVLDPVKGSSRTTPKTRWKNSRCPGIPKMPPTAAAPCPSRVNCGSSATTSVRIRPRSITAWRPARKCVCVTPISSPAAKPCTTMPAIWWNCAASTIPRAAAARAPTAARSRAPSTGSPRAMPCPPPCACTSICSRPRTPMPCPKARPSWMPSIPTPCAK